MDDGTITNLALVGRARTLLDLGLFTEAAAAASPVPTEFPVRDRARRKPAQAAERDLVVHRSGPLVGVGCGGRRGTAFHLGLDPRVPVDSLDDDGDGFADTGLDLITPQYMLLKYPDATAPVPVADGIEARLIEAEAQLQAGNRSGMTTTLNDLRQSFPDFGLGNLSTPGTQAAAVDLLFSERAFWLYATGHRLGDMRRLVRPRRPAMDGR